MRFFFNLATGLVTSTLAGNSAAAPAFNFQSLTPIELQFHRDGIPERLPADRQIVFAFKETGRFDDAPAASTASFDRPNADSGFYTGTLNTNTTACAALLAVDSSAANDQSAKTLGVQISYKAPGDQLPTRSQIFTGTLRNAVIRQGDVPPVENPGSVGGLTLADDLVLSGSGTTTNALAANTAGVITVSGSGTHTLTLPTGATNDAIERRVEFASGSTATVRFTSGGTELNAHANGSGQPAVGFYQFRKSASAWKRTGLNGIGVNTPSGGATAPGAPTSVVATPGNASASVAFTAPGNNGGAAITGYTVTASPGGFTASGSSSPINVTGLTNGTAYTFTVTATNSAGTSSASAASAAVTPLTVPGAPAIGTATQTGATTATLAFTAPASNGGASITGYRVTPVIGGTPQTPINISSTTSPLNITGLTPATSYTFLLAATNAAGTGANSAASNSITTASGSATLPAGITFALNSVALSGANSSPVASWAPSVGNFSVAQSDSARQPSILTSGSGSGTGRAVVFDNDVFTGTENSDELAITSLDDPETPIVLDLDFSLFARVRITDNSGIICGQGSFAGGITGYPLALGPGHEDPGNTTLVFGLSGAETVFDAGANLTNTWATLELHRSSGVIQAVVNGTTVGTETNEDSVTLDHLGVLYSGRLEKIVVKSDGMLSTANILAVRSWIASA